MSPSLAASYETRDVLLRRLEEDLLGSDLDANLQEPPLSRFVVGVLYPETVSTRAALTIEEASESDPEAEVGRSGPDAAVDPGVSLSHVRFPRAMGVTFALDSNADTMITTEVRASRYTEVETDRWQRAMLPTWTASIDCSSPDIIRRQVTEGLELQATVRPARAGRIAVTVSLVNINQAEPRHRDSASWFNPQVIVRSAGAFRERPDLVAPGIDEDELASQHLLFRDTRSYAVGHGCAAVWNADGPVTSISTSFLPRHELLLSEAGGGSDLDLSMDKLAADESFEVLDRLVAQYEDWLDQLTSDWLPPDDAQTLARHLSEATGAAHRMRTGIGLLRGNDEVRRAFQLMNLAMAQQRSRQQFHREGQIGDPPNTAAAQWRPFQIAFILLNLRGLVEPESEDRRFADLLWFPTGGGKTEAYLGIIGLAILLRRLQDPAAGGVSVLMRYTLRLLTLQQYQRATGLICALEVVRLEYMPNTEPISIGLWVGQASTPNRIDDALRALNRHARRRGVDSADEDDFSDPVQLLQCPWCGEAMSYLNYEIVDRSWMKVSCGRVACKFRNGLPVHIVDEDIYREQPSLIISTVDKFAMLPWKQDVGRLLGAHSESGSRPPPDLIVQDELHLISGPMGTMVGLYETAVDAICGRGTLPKVVASTATIRRAQDQVRAVFAREARQFPPPALTQGDSWFAVEATRDKKASRGYAGVMAPGTSHATLMVRVYASLLQSAAALPADDASADLYWTLLGYFNSLRVLGGAYIQVMDDVPDQIKVIAERRKEKPREHLELREMTSRRKSSEIPEELRILELQRGADRAADVVLATNMISVGVDVDRLGLMVMMGQPQLGSEYIQATSRVGRQLPGLVVTLYNSARSRDISHYENFTAYHRMLYRHVEATGATPFAPRARDRALHAVLVSMTRHLVEELSPSTAAGDARDWEGKLKELAGLIVDRARSTHVDGPVPTDEDPDVIRAQLHDLIDEWVCSYDVDHYEGWFDRRPGSLLDDASRAIGADEDASQFPPGAPPWPTLTSMRDVDAESRIYVTRARRRSGGQ
ncbi:MAG TPA: helicase-related protein [Microlunatus sp.]